MNRLVTLVLLGIGLTLLSAVPVLAQQEAETVAVAAEEVAEAAEVVAGAAAEVAGAAAAEVNPFFFNRYLGAALIVIGAAFGISRLASSAYDGMSRQPEVAGTIQTGMIIAAALIEGFTFFALLICMLF